MNALNAVTKGMNTQVGFSDVAHYLPDVGWGWSPSTAPNFEELLEEVQEERHRRQIAEERLSILSIEMGNLLRERGRAWLRNRNLADECEDEEDHEKEVQPGEPQQHLRPWKLDNEQDGYIPVNITSQQFILPEYYEKPLSLPPEHCSSVRGEGGHNGPASDTFTSPAVATQSSSRSVPYTKFSVVRTRYKAAKHEILLLKSRLHAVHSELKIQSDRTAMQLEDQITQNNNACSELQILRQKHGTTLANMSEMQVHTKTLAATSISQIKSIRTELKRHVRQQAPLKETLTSLRKELSDSREETRAYKRVVEGYVASREQARKNESMGACGLPLGKRANHDPLANWTSEGTTTDNQAYTTDDDEDDDMHHMPAKSGMSLLCGPLSF
jgi:hypothetical protein